MLTRLCANPVFLLIGLLLTLAGVFIVSLAAARWLLGLVFLTSGAGIIFLSQHFSARKAAELNKPAQRQK